MRSQRLRACSGTPHLSPRILPRIIRNSQPGSRLASSSFAAAELSSSSSGDPSSSSPWSILLVPCLKDNYAYLIVNRGTGHAAVVDPSESGPVEREIETRGLNLTHILCTHHHWDHTGGNQELKAKYGAKVVGPAADEARIPGIDVALGDGEDFALNGLTVRTLHTPGHTSGHCSFYAPDVGAAFTGDTLFSLGCGRLFEGTPEQMWTSLSRLSSLPGDTRVFCGHEYTLSNAKFALSVEPENEHLQSRVREIQSLRSQDQPTIPSTIASELACNPFLRPQSPEIRSSVKMGAAASDTDVFAAIRRAKDNF